MVFAHDTEAALSAVAALVNTLPGEGDGDGGAAGAGDGEQLAGPADLDAFVTEHRYTGSRAHDEAELAAVRALRPRLRRLWDLDLAGVVDEVNAMLRETGALPQLVDHDGWGPHLHATTPDAPLAERMLVEAAMAMVDVVRQDELERLRRCAADDCGGVLVDLSKNRSRRYCSTACANRVNVAAFRARQRASD